MKKSIPVLSSLAAALLLFSQVAFAHESSLPTTDSFPEASNQVPVKNAEVKVTNLLSQNKNADEKNSISTLQPLASLAPPALQKGTTFNFSQRDFGESVVQTSDGGYVFVGSTTVNGNEDILFAKTDASLALQWAYALGGAAEETGAEVRQTSDGGYIIAGTSNASGSKDIYLAKTDANGAIQWAKTYGGPGQEEAAAMEIGHDGGYVIVGAKGDSQYTTDAFMLKVDASGNVQWSRTYGQVNLEDRFYGVSVTPDGGYVGAGYKTIKQTIPGGTEQAMYGLMVKVSGSGATEFESTLDKYSMLHGVAATSSGYVAAGSINNFGQPNSSQGYNIFVTKVSTSGGKLWANQFHSTNGDFANDVKAAKDGNYIVTGLTSPQVGKEDLVLMKVNNAGNALWSNMYDFGNTGEIGKRVATTNDGGYVVTGSFQKDSSNGNYDVLLAKFTSD
ncbi:hypothetical protein [Paenibacillus oleatilyticus]|uniref:hypothetical protein n=1 Tax=Paenibacillus oleatilyticus TaxID=2594886 RepID=UPI001C1FBA4B|nr:hypothetical protein [Paenibacillus oleatilyticus]MBU7317062.1 hypothetical protein [Paenibacillus oleatilyticus]